jgi:hypothetical protein
MRLRLAIFAVFHASWQSFHLLSLAAVMRFRALSSDSGARATVTDQLPACRNNKSAARREETRQGGT